MSGLSTLTDCCSGLYQWNPLPFNGLVASLLAGTVTVPSLGWSWSGGVTPAGDCTRPAMQWEWRCHSCGGLYQTCNAVGVEWSGVEWRGLYPAGPGDTTRRVRGKGTTHNSLRIRMISPCAPPHPTSPEGWRLKAAYVQLTLADRTPTRWPAPALLHIRPG